MGDLFGGDEKQTTTSSTVVDLPSWIESPMKGIVSRADALSQQGFNPYTDPRFADFTGDEQAAFQLTRDLVGQNGYNVDPSQQISAEVARRGLEGFSQSELQPYMNPYIENVLDINKRRQFDTFDQTMNDYRGRAGQAAAFGGSRFGLGEAQMSQDFQQQMADFDQQGLYDSFNQGLQGAMQGTQLAGQTSMDLANLQGLEQQGTLQDANALMGIGGLQRAQQQQGLDFDYAQFQREQAFPYEQLQFASGIINPAAKINAGSTQTDVTETEGGSGWLGTAIGLGSMALGIPGVGALAGGALGGLGSSIGGGMLSGGLQGIGGGMAAGLSGSSIARMGVGGARGMYGPGFNKGGLVTAATGYAEGGMINGIQEYPSGAPEEMTDPNGLTRQGLQALWNKGFFGNPQDVGPTPEKDPLSNITPYFDTLAFIESSNDPTKVNKNSKAAGLFQFIPSTAKAYNLKDPKDPVASFEAVQRLTDDNRKTLKKNLGRNPTEAELYLAHQQGATGASKLLKNPNKKAVNVLGKKAVTQNGGDPDMTAQEFADKWLTKFNSELRKRQDSIEGGEGSTLIQGGEGFDRLKDGLGGILQNQLQRMNKDWEEAKNLPWHEVSPGDTLTQRLGTGLKNIPVGLAKAIGSAASAPGEKIQEMNTQKLYTPAESIMPGVENTVKTPQDSRALYNAQNTLLAQRGINVSGNPQQEELAQQVDPAAILTQAAFGEQQEEASTMAEEPKKEPKEDKYSDFNLPLIAFGAQLLTSRNGFKRALGEAAKTGISTKMEIDKNRASKLSAEAENALKRRSTDLQELRVGAELARLEQSAPYMKVLKELEMQEKLKNLSGSKDLEKAINTLSGELIKANPGMTAIEARQEASKAIMATRVGDNLNNSGTGLQNSKVFYTDFVPNSNK